MEYIHLQKESLFFQFHGVEAEALAYVCLFLF